MGLIYSTAFCTVFAELSVNGLPCCFCRIAFCSSCLHLLIAAVQMTGTQQPSFITNKFQPNIKCIYIYIKGNEMRNYIHRQRKPVDEGALGQRALPPLLQSCFFTQLSLSLSLSLCRVDWECASLA